MEDGRARHEDSSPGADHPCDGLLIDAAVNLNGRGVAGAVEERANRGNLGFAAGDESLSAKPGVDRHDQHEVDVAGDLERDDGRRRVQNDASLRAKR